MKTKKIILVLFFIALFLRVIYIFTLNNTDIGTWDEEGWEIAKNLVEGKGYKMWCGVGDLYSGRPPIFPLFLAGIFIIFGQNIIITKIFLAVFNSLICLVIFSLGKKIFNQKVGLMAMAVSAVYPPFIYWGGQPTQETLTILFLALATLFLLKIEEKEKMFLYAILSGVFLGMLVMTRSMAYVLIFLFPLWSLFLFKNRKQGLIAAYLVLLPVILIISPWVIRNYKIHHTILLASTEGGMTFYAANNPDVLTKGGGDFYVLGISTKEVENLSEIESDKYFYKKGLDFIRANPMIYLRLVFERLIRFWRFFPHLTSLPDSYKPIHIVLLLITDTPIILLGFWGLIMLYKIEKKQAFLLILIFLNFMIISMLIRSSIRYRAPIMPYLIILACYPIYSLYTRIKSCHVD